MATQRRAPGPGAVAARHLRCLLLALAAAVAAAMAASAATGKPSPAALHLVRADMLQTGGRAGVPVPRRLDPGFPSGNWMTAALPDARPVPAPWRGAASHAEADTVTWYRLQVPAFAPSAALYLYAARVKADGSVAVYVDGRQLEQRPPEGPAWQQAPLWVALQPAQDSAPRTILLRLHYPRGTATAVSSLWLGTEDALGWRHQGRQWLQVYLPVMGAGAFLAVGLFALFVWIRRGSGAGYGLFALLAMVQSIRALGYLCGADIGGAWLPWLMLNSLFWSIGIVHALLVSCHGQRQRPLYWSLVAAGVAVGLCSLPWFDGPVFAPLVQRAAYGLAIAAGIAVGAAGVRAAWGRSIEGLLIAGGVFACLLFGANDWALNHNLMSAEGWYLEPYTNLQNFILLCYVMHQRYARAQRQVRRSAGRLERGLEALETELAASHRRVSQFAFQQAVAEERQRMMQEMHDGLGSSLHSALRAIESGRLDAAAVADILRACIDDLHLTIDALEPVEADLLLLLATLRYRMAIRLRDAGIALRWEVVDVAPLDWLDQGAALHILRILQEALTNIVKHTAATIITVSTAAAGEGVRIVVADNGGGFDLAQALHRGGQGLANQQRRAAAIGGTMAWETGAHGTRVLLWLPTLRQMPPAPAPIF